MIVFVAVITLLSMVISTVAWFSVNTFAGVDTLDVHISVAAQLKVSMEDHGADLSQYVKVIHTAMTVTPNDSNVYYADIDANHNKLYFTVKDWNGVNYKRTQTFTNLNGDGLSQVQSLLFYTNGTYTDLNNAWAGKENITGASFASYYNSASLSPGQTLDLSLASGIDYGGQSIAYSSGDTSIFTVTDDGVVTAEGAGTVNLTYTVTSSMGDTIQRTAKIVVHSYNVSSTTITNAPVVTNLLVKAHSSEEVWWFIQNGDDEYANSSVDAAYTHDGLFLSV